MASQQLHDFLAGVEPEYAAWTESCRQAGFVRPKELAVATEDELTRQGIHIGAARIIIQQAIHLYGEMG